MGSGRASATPVLPTDSYGRETTVAGLRAAVGDHMAEGQGDWGQAWRVGNEILDPAIEGEARDQTLTEALRPWVKEDGWGAPPGGAAFWPDPDPAWGAPSSPTLLPEAEQWTDQVESLRETLLEDHGRDADYFDVAAAAERYAPDDPTLVAEVMTHWDDPAIVADNGRPLRGAGRKLRIHQYLADIAASPPIDGSAVLHLVAQGQLNICCFDTHLPSYRRLGRGRG